MAIAARFIIPLSDDGLAAVLKPVNGRGGFQDVMRRVQARLIKTSLELDEDDYDALLKACSQNKGGGGFQARARAILTDIVTEELRAAAAEGRLYKAPAPATVKPAGKVLQFTPQASLPFGVDDVA
jgi:hypothetical protein